MRVLAGSCTQNSTPFHIFSFFMKTHIRLTKMLRDDVLLHKMYTKATDEREALLWQKAGRQAFWVVVPGLVLAALAAGYWSATVCMTLLGAALFTAVTTKALRFYYMRKF